MTSRDQRLAATKYAGKKSASQAAREKSRGRTVPQAVAEDPMEAMRRAIAAPRTEESRGRAEAHKRSLPRLG
jgi:hypothetical protein